LDEWFVVSLLKEITIKIPGLVARVTDSDGEILLIEVADHLPRWAGEPSIAAGRVFLHQGMIHLIPLCESPGQVTPIPADTPHPSVCAQVVASYPHLSRAGEKVQQALDLRLDGMPHNIAANHHNCTVSLPRRVARLLALDKSWLSRIITAVVERDQLDIKHSRLMKEIKQENVRDYTVKFSKCLFAMITSCRAIPIKRSDWILSDNKSSELGFKLALGLEILISRIRAEGPNAFSESNGWKIFISRLEKMGYFQGEIAGSKQHQRLKKDAQSFWVENHDNDNEENLQEALTLSQDIDDLALYRGVLSKPGVNDSEEWLEVTPESFDKLLEAQFGVSHKNSGGPNIPEEIDKFLNAMSDMTGVEHDVGMKFDADNIVESMQELMQKAGFDEDTQSESDSDYSEDEDPIMMDYMQRLDEEVTGKDTDRKNMPDIEKPLEVDASVLSNLIASYTAQADMGGHGPASSLLQSIRVNPGRPDT